MKKDFYQDITINPNDIPFGSRIFVINTTVEYNGYGSPFGIQVISVHDKEELIPYGFNTKTELNAIWNLIVGEKYDSEDYENSVNVIRLY